MREKMSDSGCTNHAVYFADSRELLRGIGSETIQLIVSSPPYWNAKDYGHRSQIGYGQTFGKYAESLMQVWREAVRSLLPDGKIAINIGNIYYNEKGENRKTTANLMNLVWNQLCQFDELRFMGTIYWEKSTSRNHKVLMGSYPYPSSFLISTALEAIFIFRKTGYRKVAQEIKELSRITKDEFRVYRDPFWRINGVHNDHPAPFPPELPRRLIKMYSFTGDKILDPFLGCGTSLIEAAKLGRNSIGIEVNEQFLKNIQSLISESANSLEKSIIAFYDARKHLICKFKGDAIQDGAN